MHRHTIGTKESGVVSHNGSPLKGARPRTGTLAPPEGRDAWLEAFALELSRLGVRVQPDFIDDLAQQLHDTQSHLDPADVAQSQWDEWPPDET